MTFKVLYSPELFVWKNILSAPTCFIYFISPCFEKTTTNKSFVIWDEVTQYKITLVQNSNGDIKQVIFMEINSNNTNQVFDTKQVVANVVGFHAL